MNPSAAARAVAGANVFGVASLWNLIACAAAFIFTCLVLHAFLPEPNIGDVGSKLRFFAAHKNDFDTIFVGSSRVYYGVSPSVFDQVLAENGIPSRSFNFGGSGMSPPEEFYVLEQILTVNPPNLKRVFLEIDDIQTIWPPGDRPSQRVVYWHDTKNTGLIVRKILDLDLREPLKRKLRMLRKARQPIARHLMLWARNISNQGRAFDLTESFLGRNQSEWETVGPKVDGHFPLTKEISGEKEFAYEKELAREQGAGLGDVALDRYADQAYRRLADRIRSTGAAPVFLVAPIFPQFPSRFSGPPPGLLLAYNKPSLYPKFYQRAARADAHHLNSAGATEFTTRMALDFLKNKREP
jgi:hypothetical protein